MRFASSKKASALTSRKLDDVRVERSVTPVLCEGDLCGSNAGSCGGPGKGSRTGTMFEAGCSTPADVEACARRSVARMHVRGEGDFS
jgi:hypothetical protein